MQVSDYLICNLSTDDKHFNSLVLVYKSKKINIFLQMLDVSLRHYADAELVRIQIGMVPKTRQPNSNVWCIKRGRTSSLKLRIVKPFARHNVGYSTMYAYCRTDVVVASCSTDDQITPSSTLRTPNWWTSPPWYRLVCTSLTEFGIAWALLSWAPSPAIPTADAIGPPDNLNKRIRIRPSTSSFKRSRDRPTFHGLLEKVSPLRRWGS